MLTVLNYHSVTNDGKFPLSVQVVKFEQQMAYIRQKRGIGTSLEEAMQHHQSNTSNIVALTFDDGYKDNYENMFPILKSYGFTATVFLIVDYIGSNRVSLWHKGCKGPFADLAEIKEMQDYGIIFGSHTMSHPNLTRISPKKAWNEISESKDWLEQKLGVKVCSFAYPTGYFNKTIKEMVKKAGYEMAVALKLPQKMPQDRFSIQRIGISNIDSFPIFKFKLSSGYERLRRIGLDKLLSRKWMYPVMHHLT